MPTFCSLPVSLAALTRATETMLTIYSQNFALVREIVSLDLKTGTNSVRYSGATTQVEADSVMLRDPTAKHSVQVLEQNYRNNTVSQELLLALFEGQTIDFETKSVKDQMILTEKVPGKIIRSGYVPNGPSTQPIIEVNGVMQFSLPGQPFFPSLEDDTILRPSFNWLLHSDFPAAFDAEVGFITGGFDWTASYNLIFPQEGDSFDLTGWATIDNFSGRTFENAKIKLIAGEVNKIHPRSKDRRWKDLEYHADHSARARRIFAEKTFDELRLYSIARNFTLHDRETKQIEFARAKNITASTIYVFDDDFSQNRPQKIIVQREFENSEGNNLGIALPKGKLRFYRSDDDGQLQFIGENMIDHTPCNKPIRVTTGNAFDLVGERIRTNQKDDPRNHWMDETFEIKVSNHKNTTPVEIRVVEHFYLAPNWKIMKYSDTFEKTDAQTIEFRFTIKPDQEKTTSYTVRYWW